MAALNVFVSSQQKLFSSLSTSNSPPPPPPPPPPPRIITRRCWLSQASRRRPTPLRPTRSSPLGAVMGEPSFVDEDKLILRGLQFHGFHGVHQEERSLGQKFLVDVDAWLDLSVAGQTDDMADTVSYTAIYRIVKEVVEGPSQNLLESVAHLVANTTLLKFPQISAVRVKVGKPHVAVPGPVDYLGVEILRHRKPETSH